MAQQLKALVLAEDAGSVPSLHLVSVTPVPDNPLLDTLFQCPMVTRHTRGIHAYTQDVLGLLLL